VAEEAMDEPGWDVAAGVRRRISGGRLRLVTSAATQLPIEFVEGNFEFVKGIVAGFVHAGGLTGWADEQAAEEPAQRRMVLPIGQERAQQVGPAQDRGIRRGLPADDDVVAAPGAGVPPIDHEFLGPEAGLAGFLV